MLAANTGLGRDVTLTFSALDGSSNPLPSATTEIMITQEAGPPTLTVGSVTTTGVETITQTGAIYAISSSAQTLTVPITLMSTAERVSYSASDGTFFTVSALSSPSLGYVIDFEANTGVSRPVTLTFEALDGSSGSFTPAVTTEITITQAAGSPDAYGGACDGGWRLYGSALGHDLCGFVFWHRR